MKLTLLIAIVFGVALGSVAAGISALSLRDVVAPQTDFSLVAEIARTSTTTIVVTTNRSAPPATASAANAFTPAEALMVTPAITTSSSTAKSTSTLSDVKEEVIVVGKSESVQCQYEANHFPNYRNLIINEVGWMGTDEDSGNEWIELKNVSDGPLAIGGYQVLDKAQQIKVTLPDKTLPVGGFVVLERGDDALPTVAADAVYTGALSNRNEALYLFDPGCFLLDMVLAAPNWEAGNSTTKHSMERGGGMRWFTYSGNAIDEIFGTPGRENSAPTSTEVGAVVYTPSQTTNNPPAQSSETISNPAPTQQNSTPVAPTRIFISEVMAGSDAGADDEFIELYNPGSNSADLTGWSLKKKTSSGAESSLVVSSRLQGLSIPAGGYFLLVHDTKYQGSVPADATWPSSYSLAYTNNSVTLYDAGGALADEVTWTEIPKNQSYARTPSDGTSFTVGMPTPKQ